MTARSMTARLKARGFDGSHATPFQRGVTVRCSRCEALVINGVPCHERGCSNITPDEPSCEYCGHHGHDGGCRAQERHDARCL